MSIEKRVSSLERVAAGNVRGLFETTKDINKIAESLKSLCTLIPDAPGYCNHKVLHWQEQSGRGRKRSRKKRRKRSRKKRRKRSRKKRRR